MIKFITIVLLALISSKDVFAAKVLERPQYFCSEDNSQICAYIDNVQNLTPKTLGQFDVHFELGGKPDVLVQNLKIEIFWESDDLLVNSVPGKLTQTATNVFLAEKVLLMLNGTWVINLTAQIGNHSYLIQIPIDIN